MPLRSRYLLATASFLLCVGASLQRDAWASPAADKPRGIMGKADACIILRVVDGDTADVQIRGKSERLRLLAIDTEESWPSAGKPVTEFGLETSRWAKSLFTGGEACWVEYGPERRDIFNRLLTYLWFKEDGQWRMFNLKTVELGYSPYFTKYGYSKHHHAAFVEAEKRAQKAKLGIWDPSKEFQLRGKYGGPDGLRAWWDERAESLKAWDAVARDRADIYDIRYDWRGAKSQAGTRVTVFTAIRQAGPQGALWVGKSEGRVYEPFEIVSNGDAKVDEVLRGTIGYYRYFSGVVQLGEDGKTLRLTVADPGDVVIAPPPRAAAERNEKAGR